MLQVMEGRTGLGTIRDSKGVCPKPFQPSVPLLPRLPVHMAAVWGEGRAVV